MRRGSLLIHEIASAIKLPRTSAQKGKVMPESYIHYENRKKGLCFRDPFDLNLSFLLKTRCQVTQLREADWLQQHEIAHVRKRFGEKRIGGG